MTRKILIITVAFVFIFYGLALAIGHFAYALDNYTPSASEIEAAKTDYLSKICSNHGGVNCSVINPDATIVCNDGTVDQSLPTIYAVPQCQKTLEDIATEQSDFMAESGCFPPSEMTCINEQSYQNLLKYFNGAGLAYSELGKNELAQCRTDIASFEKDNKNYRQCLSDNGKPDFELSGKEILPILKTVFCPLFYGNNSSYDSGADLCLCDTGYFLNNGQCVQATKICQEKYGSSSSARNGNCSRPTPTPATILKQTTPTPIITPRISPNPSENILATPGSSEVEPREIFEVQPRISPDNFAVEPKRGFIQSIFGSIISGIKNMLRLF